MIEKDFDWGEKRKREAEAFLELLDKKSLRERLFDEKFADAIAKRRFDLEERNRRLQLFQGTILLMLGFSLLSGNASVSLFGFSSSRLENLRELLLLVSASIPLYGLMSSTELQNLTDMLAMWVKKEAGSDVQVQRALKLKYGLEVNFDTPEILGRRLNNIQKFQVFLYFVGLISWFFLSFLTVIFVEVAAAVSIILTPSFSSFVSWLVVFYVLLANVANFGSRAASGSLSVIKR